MLRNWQNHGTFASESTANIHIYTTYHLGFPQMEPPGTKLSTHCEKTKSNKKLKDARTPIVTDNRGNRNLQQQIPSHVQLKEIPTHWEKLLQKAYVHFSSNFQMNSERGTLIHHAVVLVRSVQDGRITAAIELCQRKEIRYCQLLLPHLEVEKNLCKTKGKEIKKK